jgi:hypothetical protein
MVTVCDVDMSATRPDHLSAGVGHQSGIAWQKYSDQHFLDRPIPAAASVALVLAGKYQVALVVR